jgi:CRISPR-associated protein Cmr2
MQTRHYLGLTIGPIGDVLQRAKTVRALWSGSYLFSWLMEHIADALESKNYTVLSPSLEKIPEVKDRRGAGLFHDRIIAMEKSEKRPETMQEDLDTVIDEALEQLADSICAIDNQAGKKDGAITFLKNFLQISCVIVKVPDGENFFKVVNGHLDNAELWRTPLVNASQLEALFKIHDLDKLSKIREEHNKDKKETIEEEKKEIAQNADPIAFLQHRAHQWTVKEYALGPDHKKFDSTINIAAHNLIQNEFKPVDDYLHDRPDPFEEWNQEQKEKHPDENGPFYHLRDKTFAIVQADGDNVGKLVAEAGNKSDLAQEFSRALLEFAAQVPDIGEKYGAMTIYCGGDDVLAFVPVYVNRDYGLPATVFDYVEALNQAYGAALRGIKDKLRVDAGMTLSFGVSLVHYKQPLYEALERTRSLLFDVAKNYKPDGEHEVKNALAVELVKHSGLRSSCTFPLGSYLYCAFKELLVSEMQGDTQLPHAVHHNLARIKVLLHELRGREGFSERLKDLFTNHFDEPAHEGQEVQYGLGLVRAWFEALCHDSPDDALDTLFPRFAGGLAIIKHLRGDA